MRITFKINNDTLITLGLFLLGLTSFQFYVYDPFYYPIVRKLLVIFGFLLILPFVIPRRTSIIFYLYVLYFLLYNFSGLFCHFSEQTYSIFIFEGLAFVPLFAYLLNINDSIIIKSINLVVITFVILNTLSLVVYFLFILKVPLPYNTVDLSSRGFLYDNFLNLLIVCNYVSWDVGPIIISRFNGLYEEPGMLGTYVCILLMIDLILFPEKKGRKKLLFLMGIFSVSMTFFSCCVFFFFFNLSVKRILYTTLSFTIIIILISSMLPKDSLEYLKQLTILRFKIEEGQFAGDSRKDSNEKFKRWIEKSPNKNIVFGNGKGTNYLEESSFSSYGGIIYETGLIGFIVILLIHLYYLFYIPIKFQQYKYLWLTLIPILSIYQGRQIIDVIALLYFIAFKNFFENKHYSNLEENLSEFA